MNPTAKEFLPSWAKSPSSLPKKVKYSKSQLKALQQPALDAVRVAPVVNFPPFRNIPASLVPLLEHANSTEFVDFERASALVEGATSFEHEAALNFYCVQCAAGPQPCHSISEIITNVRRREQQTVLGAFLFQPGHVVMGLVQLRLVFDSKKSSIGMRKLQERAPKAVSKIKEFLCGEGFHIPPPAVTAHEQWKVLNQKLKFDWIRDSKTVVYTELSKYWKKSHTQFEQFAHFLFFRDDVPSQRTRNMITHAQKPIIVSVLAGDLEALVMLSELGFFVPPDYYWSFPFFKDTAADPKLAAVLRHLCVYYYQKNSERSDIPVVQAPASSRSPPALAPRTALEAVVGRVEV